MVSEVQPIELDGLPGNWSLITARVYQRYISFLCSELNMQPDQLIQLGWHGRRVIEIEFDVMGADAYYAQSVMLPIRNVVYSACNVDRRMAKIQPETLKEPLLDWGCGLGFMLAWLKEYGLTDLYGWDYPGSFQSKLAKKFLAENGIEWGEPDTLGTTICVNVLEHLEDPLETATRLRAKSKVFIVNYDDSPGPGHLLDMHPPDCREQVHAMTDVAI